MLHGWLVVAEDAMQYLISQGQRPTPQRFAVVRQLAAHHEGMTFGDLLASVREELPMLATGTLHRNLACLMRYGIVMPKGDHYFLRATKADPGTARNGTAHGGGEGT